MAEKVIFEYRAGEGSQEPRVTIRGMGSAIFAMAPFHELCVGLMGCSGRFLDFARPSRGAPGGQGLRQTLDAMERMYEELYGSQVSRGRTEEEGGTDDP